MQIVLLHTYAQMLFQWVVVEVLLVGTIVALLIEPASALVRRWAMQPAPHLLARAWVHTAAHLRARPWLLVLLVLGGVLAVALQRGARNAIAARAFVRLGLLVASLHAPERFAGLVRAAPTQPLAVAGAVGVAACLGAAHALLPGHSKTLVAAYLVGTRGTSAQALLLGLSVTATHTAGVFVLGACSLALSNFIAPEQWLPWIEAVAGGLVVLLGVQLVCQRLRSPHDHTRPHDHGPHTHTHLPTAAGTRGWLLLGIAGGLVPCPSALVLLLTAVGLGRTGLGLLLTAAFSMGLAGVLTGVGLLFVHGRHWLSQRQGLVPAAQLTAIGRVLPVASAVFVTLVGIGITLSALAQTSDRKDTIDARAANHTDCTAQQVYPCDFDLDRPGDPAAALPCRLERWPHAWP